MLDRLRFASLLPLAALLGCSLPTATPSQPVSGDWENWQIQAGTTITSPPTGLYFVGAVQTLGTQSSAIFTTSGFGGLNVGPGIEVLGFSGTYDSSTGIVNLYPVAGGPFAYAMGFTEPSVPNTVIPISLVSGCVYPLNYTGVECLALIAISPAVGIEISPVTGTYVGTLTATAPPGFSGTATLTLTQASAPNSSGQFPLSGTIVFPSGSNLGTVPLAGTIAGESIVLSDPAAAPNSPSIAFTAATNPTATQITVTNLAYSGSGISAAFTGTLVRQ